MRSLASAILVVTAIGMGAPALAAEPLGTHQAPAAMPAPAAHAPAFTAEPTRIHRTPASMPAGAAQQDRDRDHDGHHYRRHHPHGVSLPFAFFDQAPVPQLVIAQPDDASPDPAPAPETPAADRPPCQETSAGVLILRGTGCTR